MVKICNGVSAMIAEGMGWEDLLFMMIPNPSCSFPSKFPMGTSTSSNSIKVDPNVHQSARAIKNAFTAYVPLALMPELSIRRLVTPLASNGMMRAEMPD